MSAANGCDYNGNIVADDAVLKNGSLGGNSFRNYAFIKKGDFSIVWLNVAFFAGLNLLLVYALFDLVRQVIFEDIMQGYYNLIWIVSLMIFSEIGITAGAHRLWSHKSYEAKVPLRVFLMIAQCVAGENCIFVWARDHRVHHKFSDTDGDPHNIRRGFFFSHVGWLLTKKHPELKRKGGSLNFQDLMDDPIVRFQYYNYWMFYVAFSLLIPTVIPVIFWGETLMRSYLFAYVIRYSLVLHNTWFVNSAAHMFGDKPYDKIIKPAQNVWVSFAAIGEGFHNYHHTFPWDYRTHEMGSYLNLTKGFIDFMELIGQAYNLKKPSQEMVKRRIESNEYRHHH